MQRKISANLWSLRWTTSIDAEGLHPDPDKVLAIQQAPKPVNVTQLKCYLGLLSYYRKLEFVHSASPTVPVVGEGCFVEVVVRAGERIPSI